jgi:hypothetical protein
MVSHLCRYLSANDAATPSAAPMEAVYRSARSCAATCFATSGQAAMGAERTAGATAASSSLDAAATSPLAGHEANIPRDPAEVAALWTARHHGSLGRLHLASELAGRWPVTERASLPRFSVDAAVASWMLVNTDTDRGTLETRALGFTLPPLRHIACRRYR